METNISKLQHQIDSITSYLTPYLSLANCHMVEFFTENHYDSLLPKDLKENLENSDLDVVVNQFWRNNELSHDGNPLLTWLKEAKDHYVSANNEYCLTAEQLQDRIKLLGGVLKPEIKVTEFMNSKKSYEVQRMSRLVEGVFMCTACSHGVEVGGGRAPLPAALTLGYGLPVLTVDCNEQAIKTAQQRVNLIQKQWRTIAKKINGNTEEKLTGEVNSQLNRFASTYVTKDTDLVALVKEKFPEHNDLDVRLLLTGLHTCGNLGPDSLRIFTANVQVEAVFNVPCCYHLLTERVDSTVFDIFQNNYAVECSDVYGFPMSEYLRGYNIGRNGRMLAAQSIDRVIYNKQLPAKSLLYRALLQAVIKKHLPNSKILEGKLKNISDKCQNFEQYFKMADSILKLGLYDTLKDTTDTQNLDCQWKKLVIFYLIRLCLAQVIESLILLDRLMYLYECGFSKVYLVKLFDPVLSPRCHSIVASR